MTLLYEEQRLQNIKDNAALLLSLGLEPPKPAAAKKAAAPKAKQAPKKKARAEASASVDALPSDDGDDEEGSESTRRSSRAKKDANGSNGNDERRRSSRQSQAPVRFTQLKDGDGYDDDDDDDDSDDDEAGYRGKKRKRKAPNHFRPRDEPQRLAQRLGIRTQNPKRFGHIPGVEVGTWWASRMDCSTAAVHAPPVSGISGNAELGAFSVALSGGYPDDVDLGEAFTYTGSGGRDLRGTVNNPKNLRTAEQTFDQSFETPANASLKRSSETRKPVRVIRGFKLDSEYAPPTGYRYDGLYTVERAWMAPGLTRGLKVCRYAFRRVDGQPPLPVRIDVDEEDEEDEEEEGSDETPEDLEGEEIEEGDDDQEEEEEEEAVEEDVEDVRTVKRAQRSGASKQLGVSPPPLNDVANSRNGRPKRASVVVVEIPIRRPTPSGTPNSRPGRPRRSVAKDETPAAASEPEPATLKRGRGRPSKNGAATPAAGPEPEMPKSGRGRPRNSLPATQPEPTARRSGRPKRASVA